MNTQIQQKPNCSDSLLAELLDSQSYDSIREVIEPDVDHYDYWKYQQDHRYYGEPEALLSLNEYIDRNWKELTSNYKWAIIQELAQEDVWHPIADKEDFAY